MQNGWSRLLPRLVLPISILCFLTCAISAYVAIVVDSTGLIVTPLLLTVLVAGMMVVEATEIHREGRELQMHRDCHQPLQSRS